MTTIARIELKGFQGEDEDNATPKDGQDAIACNSPPRPVPLGPARRLSGPDLPEYANDDMDTADFTPLEHLSPPLPANHWFLHQHVRATHTLKEKAEELKTKLDETNAALAEMQQSPDKSTDEPYELNLVGKPLASSDDRAAEPAKVAESGRGWGEPKLRWSRS